MMTDADLDRIDRAFNAQVEQCVEEKGYDFWHSDVPPSEYLIPVDRRYGIWDLAAASADGYELPARFLSLREKMDDEAEKAYANRSEAQDRAEIECLRSVEQLPVIQRGVLPDVGDDRSLYLPAELDGQAYFLALEDPRAKDAFAAWAACLEDNGLTRGEGPEQLGPADIPDELEAQIRVAVIDVTCKRETRFIERLSSLEAQYQAALIDQNQAALDASVQKQAEILRRADEIIATHG
ncbi:hypothetical protein [Microbacterium sp. No. 7]|uniref:hypothetical protein n=1 Tax=Microbacterium sp. No. 7 TaxID=1714373 RepID=UPI0012E1B280|nr:hypothetical protein [Microbacterium sp. No. 7]